MTAFGKGPDKALRLGLPGLRNDAFDQAVKTMKHRPFITAFQRAYEHTGDDPIGPGMTTVIVNGHTVGGCLSPVNFDVKLFRLLGVRLTHVGLPAVCGRAGGSAVGGTAGQLSRSRTGPVRGSPVRGWVLREGHAVESCDARPRQASRDGRALQSAAPQILPILLPGRRVLAPVGKGRSQPLAAPSTFP